MEKYKENILDRIGIPHALAWGYLGILIFMMGDGVEQGWLSKYLIDGGLTEAESALVFTVYGVTIGISSWLSGVLSDMWGVRRTMFYGLIIYLLGVIGFVSIGLGGFNFALMLIMYGIKGFGYPLFAYTFLVWIAKKSPGSMLGKAVGWFWFVFKRIRSNICKLGDKGYRLYSNPVVGCYLGIDRCIVCTGFYEIQNKK